MFWIVDQHLLVADLFFYLGSRLLLAAGDETFESCTTQGLKDLLLAMWNGWTCRAFPRLVGEPPE
jgi:hypothetical protein